MDLTTETTILDLTTTPPTLPHLVDWYYKRPHGPDVPGVGRPHGPDFSKVLGRPHGPDFTFTTSSTVMIHYSRDAQIVTYNLVTYPDRVL